MNLKELKSKLLRETNKVWFAVSYGRDPSTFGHVISKIQGTKYTHVLVIYFSLDLMDFVIANAHGQAAQLDLLEQFDAIDEVQYLFEKDILPNERLNLMHKIVELDGIGYSKMQIVDIGIHSIFGIKMKANGLDGIICSEYGDRLSQSVGLPSATTVVDKTIELINPKDSVKAWRKFCSQMVTFREIT